MNWNVEIPERRALFGFVIGLALVPQQSVSSSPQRTDSPQSPAAAANRSHVSVATISPVAC